MQAKNGTTWYRLQINPDNSTGVFKSIDNGTTWPIFERFITESGSVKIKSGYINIATTASYGNEYQGSMSIPSIISAFSLTDKTVLTVICRGGNLISDGAIVPKHGSDGSIFTLSGAVSGTYRMHFDILYK
ncbi:hypothetical protein LAD12857_00520 [Lacrimispora amygdalina]|uniref:Uncharacterized protein n=1 Tax=Lacrimispora amygdalina TaxID=253257 RepID=A0ABQ5M0H6_9FIRM